MDLPPASATVVIPTFNERENLEALLAAVLAQGAIFRALVVDDNSPDGTGALADRLAVAEPRIEVVHRASKQGLGPAYLAGFRRALDAGATYIIEMDADFSHAPADLPRLLAPVQAGEADLTLGSRWVPGGGTRDWPLRRQWMSRAGSAYARLILGVQVLDLTGGFKCYHRRVLEALDLDAVRASGYGFQIELTYRALQAGFRVREVPIVFRERARGTSKMSAGIAAEGAGLVWRLRFGQRGR